ncbi:MAG: hypothetical protein GY913_10550 [Proteobacteria bacterium]|nr:hypothetical protein [Pseudomonadota bacterium]MCP4917353.1 hypothetical protein [Pseudomonadota bacterium]
MEKTGERTELVPGARGEFTIWVDGRKVAGKGPDGFPSSEQVLDVVTAALG